MISCKTSITGNRIDVNCTNTEGEKSVTLEIYELESNFKLVDYKFNIVDIANIWNTLIFNTSQFEFINGFRIKIINNETKDIEYDDILLTKPYTKTKFIDKNNILSHSIIGSLSYNFFESFVTFKDDPLNIKNDKVLLDLGSTVGVFTAYALEQNPNIKSICVEMNPNLHKVCVDTFKDNPNIIPIHAAIYKESGTTVPFKSLSEDLYDLGNTIVDNLYIDQTHVLNVNTISVEDIMRTYDIERISLMKVDIEGYEYELFENLSDEILDKTDKILLEFHRVHDPNRRLNLINRLQIKGFQMKVYDEKVNFYSTHMFTLLFTK